MTDDVGEPRPADESGGDLTDEERQRLLDVVRRSDDEEELRRVAMRLGDAGVAEAVEPLVSLLERSAQRGGGARDGAAIGLRELGDPRALEPIMTAIRRSPPDQVGTLVYALQAFDCAPIVAFLADLAATGAYEVRSGVAGCFERLDPATLPADACDRATRTLRDAAERSTDPADREQLLWLAEALA